MAANHRGGLLPIAHTPQCNRHTHGQSQTHSPHRRVRTAQTDDRQMKKCLLKNMNDDDDDDDDFFLDF